MPLSSHPSNGLLLLLRAAQKVDEEDVRKSYNSDHRLTAHRSSFPTKYSHYSHKRPATTIRCTHNELEKSRRAQLRTWLETLKEQLNFDNDVPRITMLTVLKKATATIQSLRHTKHYFENREESERQRFARLVKERRALKKVLEQRRNAMAKLQNWKERNRNCSECSVYTTSSDDSELDGQRSVTRPVTTASFGPPTLLPAVISSIEESHSTVYIPSMHKRFGGHSSPKGSLDVFDNSYDSGFEEVTVVSSGSASPDEDSMKCAIDEPVDGACFQTFSAC